MAGQTLLLVDKNEDFRIALAQRLCNVYHVRSCANGRQALEQLRQTPCDVLVLDLMLPELDGISLLERLATENIRPVVLVVTSMCTDYVLSAAARLGIGYLMLKPCDPQTVCDRLQDLNRPLNPGPSSKDPYAILSEILISLGFAAKMRGFPCLKEAIIQMERDPHQMVTKELYPAVAKAFPGKNAAQVERSIRNAIHTIWQRHGAQLWSGYFPHSTRPPSNAQFLAQMAEVLHRELE